MYSLSQQDTSRDNRLNMLVESRVRREVQARFGGEFLETYRRNTARHRVLRERKTNCVKVCIRDDFGITKNPEIVP